MSRGGKRAGAALSARLWSAALPRRFGSGEARGQGVGEAGWPCAVNAGPKRRGSKGTKLSRHSASYSRNSKGSLGLARIKRAVECRFAKITA